MTPLTPPLPPMGWNSWNCYETTVTEAEVPANARFMAGHLLPYGWDTVVVDIDWADATARSHGYNEDAPLELGCYRGGRPVEPCARFRQPGLLFSARGAEWTSFGRRRQ